MFHRKIDDVGFIFVFGREQVIHLHMFFVFFPIDLVFLNHKQKVVEVKKLFSPFHFYSSRAKALYLLELPLGTVEKSKTQVGDFISF